MYVFYDTETTGIEPDFTQVLQISLIFADDNLNILSSKKLECRTSPWVVPAPGALLTTGFVPDDLKFNKLSSYEMMQEVNDWIRGQYWPVTFVGYNSIGYDEPVLAQNLYQNLLDPSLTTSANDANNQNNGRADVMLMVRAVELYMPGALKLDAKNYYGGTSHKLGDVAAQNGVELSSEDAHDAMNDAKATMGVAKVVQKAAPQIWEQILKLSTAAGVDDFLKNHEVFTYTDAVTFDETAKKAVKMTAAAMTSLAERADGSRTQVLFNLNVDPAPYLGMTADQLKDVLLGDKAKNPFVSVQKAGQPVLMPMDLSDEVLPDTADPAQYAARAKAIHANQEFLENVAAAALLAKPQPAAAASRDMPELKMNNPVSGPVRQRLDGWMGEFHDAAGWHARAALVKDFYTRFEDDLKADPSLSRFVKLAGRIVYEHAPEELSTEKQAAMKKHIAGRILNPDPKAPYMTIAKARKELNKIEWQRAQKDNKKWADVTDSQIRSLKLYYTALEKEYAPFAPSGAAPANNNVSPTDPKKASGEGFKPK